MIYAEEGVKCFERIYGCGGYMGYEVTAFGMARAFTEPRSLERKTIYPALFVLSGQGLELESYNQGANAAVATDRP